jgi:hypothetical protein
MSHTVDGRNPAPVAMWFLPGFIAFQHVSTIQGGVGFFESTILLNLIGHP